MADLTLRRDGGADRPPRGSDGDDVAGADASAYVAPDPRAVRARLAPPSASGDEPPISLAPVRQPPATTNPGTGIGRPDGDSLDGDPPTAAVVAQRQRLVNGELADLDLVADGQGRYRLLNDGVVQRVILGPVRQVEGGRHRREVLVDGYRFEVDVESERIASLRERAERGRAAGAHSGPLEIRAIIPGRVVSVAVAAGDTIAAGEQLLVVEAMKMQNELRAPRDGTVARLVVGAGETVEVGDLLAVIS